jgi:hypothetical protein
MSGPIFIGGVPRSGTTLFRAMLHAHPRIHCGPERKLVAPLVRAQRDWWAAFGPMLPAAGIQRRTLDAAAGAYLRTLLAQSTPPGLRPAEKTPNIMLFVGDLARMLPEARFVHVVRDGRAVAASLVRQDWVDPKTGAPVPYTRDLESAAVYWARYLAQVAPQLGAVQGRYLEVRYEGLVRSPRAVMERVLTFLGEPWHDAVLAHERSDARLPSTEASSEAVREAVHTRALDAWRSRLAEHELARLEEIIGPVLRQLGYATWAPGSAGV